MVERGLSFIDHAYNAMKINLLKKYSGKPHTENLGQIINQGANGPTGNIKCW